MSLLLAKLIAADSAIALQNACLLLASHKVLLSFIRNNEVPTQPTFRCFFYSIIGTNRSTAVHAAIPCLCHSPWSHLESLVFDWLYHDFRRCWMH